MGMDGTKPIVMRLSETGCSDNGRVYHEHMSIESARREAHRLAGTVTGGSFVVYVPVAIVAKTPPTTETAIQWDLNGEDSLPF